MVLERTLNAVEFLSNQGLRWTSSVGRKRQQGKLELYKIIVSVFSEVPLNRPRHSDHPSHCSPSSTPAKHCITLTTHRSVTVRVLKMFINEGFKPANANAVADVANLIRCHLLCTSDTLRSVTCENFANFVTTANLCDYRGLQSRHMETFKQILPVFATKLAIAEINVGRGVSQLLHEKPEGCFAPTFFVLNFAVGNTILRIA